jgi:hypothetical protein
MTALHLLERQQWLADCFQSTKIISMKSAHTTREWTFGVIETLKSVKKF